MKQVFYKKNINMSNVRKFKQHTEVEINLVEMLFNKIEMLTGIEKKIILSKNRKTNVVMARMIIATILRNEANLSLMKIGVSLEKDHSTILYYVNKHTENLFYPIYNEMYFNILDRIIFNIKKTDVDFLDKELERAISKVNNLKHKKKLLIWATRRYEARSL